ncbi:hypothetical protein PI125_g22769 [Phytophthora idaei]|nr:hypothetical protein PI125_g22769 [Phytophthora idaei]
MWQGGAKRKKILRYLKESPDKPILPEDKTSVKVNVVNVFRVADTKLTSCITFQISHMRRMASLFPEVICVDATHGTNINRYRLFRFSGESHNAKYGSAFQICKGVAEVITDKGTSKFNRWLENLKDLEMMIPTR